MSILLLEMRKNKSMDAEEAFKRASCYFPSNTFGDVEKFKLPENMEKIHFLRNLLKISSHYSIPNVLFVEGIIIREDVDLIKGKFYFSRRFIIGHTFGFRSIIADIPELYDDEFLVKNLAHELGHQKGLLDHYEEKYKTCIMYFGATKYTEEFCKECEKKLLKLNENL